MPPQLGLPEDRQGPPRPAPLLQARGVLRFDPDELEAWLARHRLEDHAEAWRD